MTQTIRAAFTSAFLALTSPITGIAAQEHPSGWVVSFAIARDAFGGGSLDSVTAPPLAVEVLPAPRLAMELGLRHRSGAWELGLSAGYASGRLRASTEDVTLDSRSGGMARYRLGGMAGYRFARFSPASLHALAGPVMDYWKSDGIGERLTWGGRAGLALRVPLGRVELENAVLFTLGSSPFDEGDVPQGVALRALRTWSVGAALNYRL